MTRSEWVKRCAVRLHRTGGQPWNDAQRDAAWLAEEQAAVYGSPASWGNPEDVADEELMIEGEAAKPPRSEAR